MYSKGYYNTEPIHLMNEILDKQRKGKFLTFNEKKRLKEYNEEQRIKKSSQKKKKR